jgi:hypothetical protein
MKLTLFHGRNLLLAGLALAVALWLEPRPTEACGPFFPNQLLLQPDSVALTAPTADLLVELQRIGKHLVVPGLTLESIDAGDLEAATARAERDDAELLLAAATPEERKATLTALDEMRAQMRAAPATAVVPALPDALRLYLEGAIAFRQGDQATARDRWEDVLDLPADERRFRSVWAAYMLGRSWAGHDRGMARLWFQKARELAAAGDRDTLGLAIASFGEEAKTHLDEDHHLEALQLYVAQAAHGAAGGVASVRRVVSASIDDPAVRKSFAGDALARQVVTASFLAREAYDLGQDGSNKNAALEMWLDAVELAGATQVDGADRLAWLCYRYGRFGWAERWLSRAQSETAITQWVRAKLALRAGQVDKAARLLAKVARAFPADERWSPVIEETTNGPDYAAFRPADLARAELALIEVSRGDYVQAADALLRAGYWLDGAYLAERVLTLKELEKLVTGRWPEPQPHAGSPTELEQTSRALRNLLARRLMRADRPLDAAAFFATADEKKLVQQVHDLHLAAEDRGAAPAARATAEWRIAEIVRRGIEIYGTELAPDWQYAGGAYELNDPLAARRLGKGVWKLGPTKNELTRAARSAPHPDRRWHYRYAAAELAWRATERMADDDPETIRRLCVAGSWIKNIDPTAADRFYKAMVRRGPNTDLGLRADVHRWFPDGCVVTNP